MGSSIPDLEERAARTTAELEAFTRSFINEQGGDARDGGFVIPIVFHIIHNNGPENISDAQVHDAVRVLNNDFNRLNTDWNTVRPQFLDIVANVGIEFRLATRDPNGQCTTGITRTQSPLTNDGTEQMKALISWPRNKYLQVWVAASADGAAGYTFRPGNAVWNAAQDGIVVQHLYLGSIGTSNAYRSRTLTHEVGHWFNLAHTWGSSNTPGLDANCNMDDEVSDTPNTRGWESCTLNGSTCDGTLDNVENYMDYSYCSKMFTVGQKARMIACLNSSTAQRNQLWQTSNLIATGVNGNAVLCQALFTTSKGEICAGQSVRYTDASYHNVMARSWSFPGGEPSTSTEVSPVVFYPNSGTYSATLTVSDGSTSLSTTQNTAVVVLPMDLTAPLIEGFEVGATPASTGWMVLNPDDDNGFGITNTAAYSGSKSLRLVNTAAMSGRTDVLVSPPLDMSDATAITLSFRYAYARRTSSSTDQLRILVSNNCGETWNLRAQIFATGDLTTGGINTGSFVPSGPEQWGFKQITNINSTFYVTGMRLRFEFMSGGGNNFFLDDINLNGMPLSLGGELTGAGPLLAVLPNPATEATEAVVDMASAGRAVVDLLDITGRVARHVSSGTLPAGKHRMKIPTADLPSGSYFVRLQYEGGREVVRLIVP
ncbi:MAG: T9SS type A sorting domain-containing protein [Flavobacteriales bacterium]|nr:T9SS type A sorting domain-containing protein [Flavobacteriales bacterium]